MATTRSAGMAIEKAHNEALEAVRQLDVPETAEHVQYLDNMGIHLWSTKDPIFLSSVQSVLISALTHIVEDQGRRLSELEKAAAEPQPKPAGAPSSATKKAEPRGTPAKKG